ncbi:putative inorganic phosphate cotransporter [Lycorma delicatula]|uniref:putative inorganic phosphate cotransporter n=1 Tax=Lycorma delicatula TaxID=130591 RepID=UPI003F511432
MMAFLGVAIFYMMRNCLSMAITAMVKYPIQAGDETESSDRCPFFEFETEEPEIKLHSKLESFTVDWDEEVQGLALASFYFGYVITQLPGGIIAYYLGAKHVLGFGTLFTAIITLLSPFAVKINYYVFIAARVIAGLASGVTFPALTVLLAHWVPPNERIMMGAIIFSGGQIGNVVSFSISGLIIKFFGWPSVFIFFGILGVIWYIIWLFICFSDPSSHPCISVEEKAYIHDSLAAVNTGKDIAPLPFCRILTTVSVWAIIITQFGHSWALYTMQNDLPKYMKGVLKYNSVQNGLVSSLPFLAMWLSAVVSGWISDFLIYKHVLSRLYTRKLLVTIAQFGPGLTCLVAVYAGCNRTLVVALFTIGVGLMGPFYASLKVNAIDLSPNYAGFIMTISNSFGSLAGGLCSVTIGYIAKEFQLIAINLLQI